MPDTVVVRDAQSGKEFTGWSGHRMYLFSESGKQSFAFDLAPRAIEYGGWSQEWVETSRTGREPLLLRKGDKLDTLKFSFMLTGLRVLHLQQTEALNTLKGLAKSRERMLVRYGPQEAGLWRITDVTVTSELRHPDTNEVTRAMASISLTRASDPAVAIGPVSGGTAPAPGGAPAAPRTYRVVKGNTLWGIAQQFYGKGTLWPRVFDANRNLIKDPHWIYPNQVFVIP
jgi:LysM repeat protein